MKKAKFEELFAGVASLSLINEPPQPIEPEKSYPAREIARRRWGMIKRELGERS